MAEFGTTVCENARLARTREPRGVKEVVERGWGACKGPLPLCEDKDLFCVGTVSGSSLSQIAPLDSSVGPASRPTTWSGGRLTTTHEKVRRPETDAARDARRFLSRHDYGRTQPLWRPECHSFAHSSRKRLETPPTCRFQLFLSSAHWFHTLCGSFALNRRPRLDSHIT